MKKRWISLFLAVLMVLSILATTASAYSVRQLNTADALYELGLFLGTGTTYALDRGLKREEGITMLIRLLGKEDEALNTKNKHPFTDVSKWADPYVGYAYVKGITKGTSATRFSGSVTMTDTMFLTMCLRALGYSDSGNKPDFKYREARKFAYDLGIVSSAAADDDFTRGEAVDAFWVVLHTPLKNDAKKTILDNLQADKVIDEDQRENAERIRTNGRGKLDGTGEKRDPDPEQPASKPTADAATWEKYMKMSAADQDRFFTLFDSPTEFMLWAKVAKAAYEKNHPAIEIGGDDPIDIGKFVNQCYVW